MPYENPQGRRLNALAALVVDGTDPTLCWVVKSGPYTADHIVRFLHALPPVPMPTVLVLDNAGIHRSKVVRAALPDLRARGLYLYFLPPYSPELNAIERSFRAIKHHHLPARRYTTLAALHDAVQDAFTAYETRLILNCDKQPRLAA
jgi:transposase